MKSVILGLDMAYSHTQIQTVADEFFKEIAEGADPRQLLRDTRLRALYGQIPQQAPDDRAVFGQEVNKLKQEIEARAQSQQDSIDDLPPIDVTAPMAVGKTIQTQPGLLPTEWGSQHPITQEIERIGDIFSRMGFTVEDSRQLDNDYNMFEALNFPENHPARDDYDTFMTEEGLIPPAHTSTMQNRILKNNKLPIRAVIPGRTYRNEDVDATHEHTFHQLEGIYVDKGITLGHMLGTIKAFLEEYFEQEIEYKTQPFFFPFVEPGLEFMIKMPKALRKGDDDSWLEIMGCGMIHPNVLREGGIDPDVYSGFAWGGGIDRMVILRHAIEDIRHFHSANLQFLRKF